MSEVQGQIYESSYQVDVSAVDLPTFVFSSNPEAQDRPQYFDADNPAENFSLTQAETWVRRWAKGLQDFGIKSNDKVLLCSGNSLYFPILFWGTLASGAVFTGCSPGSSLAELSHQVKDSDARLILADPKCLNLAMQVAESVGLPSTRVLVFSRLGDTSQYPTRRWTDIWASEKDTVDWDWKRITSREEAQATTAVINYSSGTTGVPKGVEISHFNIVANSTQVAFKRRMVANTPKGRARKERIALSGERWLAPLPMFHAYGQAYYCTTAAIMGCKVFIMPTYDRQRYLLYLDIYRINFLTGVPTVLVSLAKDDRASSYNLKAVESVLSGSAPLNAEIGKLIKDTYLRPEAQVKQGWGLTETTCSATGFAQDDDDDGRSIGWLNPNMSAKIVLVEGHEGDDAHDTSSKRYLVGEMWVSGPNVMKGYYKRPKETSDSIVIEGKHRWFKTGDIGYVDDKGRFYIIDRLKELIKVKGLQVAPTEIEQTLLTHPNIADAAVLGVKTSNGEYPKAFVVVKDQNTVLTSREVQQYIEGRLSKHKWLTGGVEFTTEIPRTASGKIQRRLLAKSSRVHAKL